QDQRDYIPWYTGPLIADNANNIGKGLVNIQPYLFFRDTPGAFNKAWGQQSIGDTFTFQPYVELQGGITTWFDITAEAQAFYKDKSGTKSFEVGDTSVKLGFQLLKEKDFTAIPSIRVTVIESFPTGKYKNLNPNKLGIDASGSGSYETIANLLIGKVVYWFKAHPIRWRINAGYTHSVKTRIKNLNAYGGGTNTNGKVSPGGTFNGILAFEFSFTQRWVLASDFVHVRSAKTTFKGTAGTNPDGTAASSTNPSSHQTSIAPALEYNFSANLGVLAGAHFSIHGNATSFKAGIISAEYTF
ncbi:MAG: hypothetical protein KR126chlam6_00372, partial [Candidatus Anoxychlamydiales bacterium]|nr:hypothetical protein [Candidatus Anoxychlamydiales bacterium]